MSIRYYHILFAVFLVAPIAAAQDVPLTVASADQPLQVGRFETVGLALNRPLKPEEGRLAVFVDHLDVSAFLTVQGTQVTYAPTWAPLPSGAVQVRVFLVRPDGQWHPLAQFPIQVRLVGDFDKLTLDPVVTLTNKGQLAEGTTPAPVQPNDRRLYQDFAGQFNVQSEAVRYRLHTRVQANVLGAGRQEEALRFFEQGVAAPRIDLSDYLVQVQYGKTLVQAGHVSHGQHRHLAQFFGSRGLRMQTDLAGGADFSVAAMNGSRVVGWSNPLGLNDWNHRMISSTLGVDFLADRPGGLRLEASYVDGALLPRNTFNQGSLTDAETSRGSGLRLVAGTSGQRLRFEGGVAGARHTNPNDPLLAQGAEVVPVDPENKFAHYLDASAGLLQNALSRKLPVTLTVAFRREQVAPLYRSVATFVRADQRAHAFDVQGGLGAVRLQYLHNRAEDNLGNIASILKTKTRQHNANLAVPLAQLFNGVEAALWPALAYSFNRTHQFGDGLPENGGFNASHIPDQLSTVHNASANWTGMRWQLGYRWSVAVQDNRQTGREAADFLNRTHAVTFGVTPMQMLNLGLDLNLDAAENKATGRIDRTRRLGVRLQLRPTSALGVSLRYTPTRAEDDARTMLRTDTGLYADAAYSFGLGAEGVRGQCFVRFNRQRRSNRDATFGIDQQLQTWTVNTGLNLTLF